MAKILDGKALSQRLMGEYKARIEEINRNDSICLAMVIAGGDPSSLQYVKANEKKCVSIGINVKIIQLDYDVTQEALEKTISELNDDASVNGVLIQMPLPKHIDKQRVVNLLSPDKDLDCQGDGNIVSLYNNTEGFCPCTPSGAIELLKGYGISLSGKNVCVLGRSSVVGKPLALMLLNENATVTVCHSKTRSLKEECLKSDIIISCTGRAGLVTADMVPDGAVVLDIGTNFVDGKLCGDVDFQAVEKVAGAISPVPGGGGPMTVTMLIKNLLAAYDRQHKTE